MIITLKGADFSSNKIGVLSSWTIFTTLGTGATYSGSKLVDKNGSLSATVTIADGYELGSAGVSVIMGTTDITSGAAIVNGNTITISIATVTGNVTIKVPTLNTSTGEEDIGGNETTDTTTVNGNTATLVALCGEDVWVDYASVDVAQTENPPIIIDNTRTNRIGAYFIKVPEGMTISCTSNYLLNITEHANPTSESYTKKISGWLNSYTPTAGTYIFIHLRLANQSAATYSPGVVGDDNAYNSVNITISGASSLTCVKSTSGDIPVYTITKQ